DPHGRVVRSRSVRLPRRAPAAPPALGRDARRLDALELRGDAREAPRRRVPRVIGVNPGATACSRSPPPDPDAPRKPGFRPTRTLAEGTLPARGTSRRVVDPGVPSR